MKNKSQRYNLNRPRLRHDANIPNIKRVTV